jgi:hypothetical protein
MNISKTFAGLLTNKYFLYFIVVISALNIIGYLSMNNIDAVIFFSLLGFLMFNFSKNMTIVLLVSIVATNLLMVSKPFMTLEGMSGGPKNFKKGPGKGSKDEDELGGFTNPEEVSEDEEEHAHEPEDEHVVKKEKKEKHVNAEKKESGDKKKKNIQEGTTSKREKFTSLSPAPVKQSSHIDYATTLEDAYKNLEKMLGDGGLQNLTADTQRLMDQQSKLFNSMENMGPLLTQAQKMMKGMDLETINKFAASSKSFNKSDA